MHYLTEIINKLSKDVTENDAKILKLKAACKKEFISIKQDIIDLQENQDSTTNNEIKNTELLKENKIYIYNKINDLNNKLNHYITINESESAMFSLKGDLEQELHTIKNKEIYKRRFNKMNLFRS